MIIGPVPSSSVFVDNLKDGRRTLLDSVEFDEVLYKFQVSRMEPQPTWYIVRVDSVCGNTETKSKDEIEARLNWIDLVLSGMNRSRK